MTNTLARSGKERPKSPVAWQQAATKVAALLFWLLVVGGYYWYTRQNNLTISDSVQRLSSLLINSLYGPLFYMGLYVLRPLIFFPATVLTVLGGFLFGPLAILYTILSSNASAMLAYAVGRYFGQGILEGEREASLIQRYTQRMRQNGFETILLMRLIFLPYDLVNYTAGFLKINWRAFLLATAIGSIPGTISVVLLGASFGTLDELLAGEIKLNPPALVISLLVIAGSVALSRTIKKREVQHSSAS